MKTLTVRFRNLEDLKTFSDKIKIPLSYNTTDVNFETKDIYLKSSKTTQQKDFEWRNHWVDLPEFETNFDKDEKYKIDFKFSDNVTSEFLTDLFEQQILDTTRSIWFPVLKKGKHKLLRVIGGNKPKYPIYIVSKNRAVNLKWHTSNALSNMCLDHYIVVEPDDYESYKEEFKDTYATVITMDMRYKDDYDCFSDLGNLNSTGPGPARNFCWDHSIKNDFKWHWVLDDNIGKFYRFWRGRRITCKSGETFRTCEEFCERYENIAIAGLNYRGFCLDYDVRPAYTLNTRIYSLLFIRNDIPYRWRGRYNEDTDLSLRVLKDKWCTVQFNTFLGGKARTQTIGGGNTEEFYANEGTHPKSQMLVDMHPDVARLMERWDRIHHYVDYSGFRHHLLRKYGFSDDEDVINERGMKVIEIPEEIYGSENDNAEYLEEHFYDDDYEVDDLYLKNKKKINVNKLF